MRLCVYNADKNATQLKTIKFGQRPWRKIIVVPERSYLHFLPNEVAGQIPEPRGRLPQNQTHPHPLPGQHPRSGSKVNRAVTPSKERKRQTCWKRVKPVAPWDAEGEMDENRGYPGDSLAVGRGLLDGRAKSRLQL